MATVNVVIGITRQILRNVVYPFSINLLVLYSAILLPWFGQHYNVSKLGYWEKIFSMKAVAQKKKNDVKEQIKYYEDMS